MYLNYNDYQARAVALTINDHPADLWVYPVMKLAGEAGELLEKVMADFLLMDTETYPDKRAAIGKEMGDVLWYIAFIAHNAGYELEDIAEKAVNLNGKIKQVGGPFVSLILVATRISEYVGKLHRDKGGQLVTGDRVFMYVSLAKMLLFLGLCAARYHFTIAEIASLNLKKCEDRQQRGVLAGSGDNR